MSDQATILPNPNTSLSARSINALKWNYLGTIFRILSQFIAQLGMARLLGPESFGSFGYALLLVGLLGLLIEQGLGSALIHVQQSDETEQRVAFWRIMLVATICSAAVMRFSEPLAQIMGAPGVASLLHDFSPAFLLIGLGVVVQARLRRNLQFREIQIAQNISYLIGYLIVGLGMAAMGHGVMSLLAAWMTQAGLAVMIMYRYSPHSIIPANPLRKLNSAAYGRDIASINLINWIIDNAMNAFIGRAFGAASLGLYNASLSLVKTPASHLVVNLQTVLFPTTAAIRDNREKSQQLYLIAISTIAQVSFPAFVLLSVVSDLLVRVLLGKEWLAAGPVLTPLALAMMPHVLSSIAGSTLCGSGNQRAERNTQGLVLVLYAGCFLLVWHADIVVACWAFLGVNLVRAAVLTAVTMRMLKLPIKFLPSIFAGPTLSALVIAAGTAVTLFGLDHPPLASDLLKLLAASAAGSLLLVICSLIFPRLLVSSHVVQLVRKLTQSNGRLGKLAGQLLRRIDAHRETDTKES